jgi:hypothetical protein
MNGEVEVQGSRWVRLPSYESLHDESVSDSQKEHSRPNLNKQKYVNYKLQLVISYYIRRDGAMSYNDARNSETDIDMYKPLFYLFRVFIHIHWIQLFRNETQWEMRISNTRQGWFIIGKCQVPSWSEVTLLFYWRSAFVFPILVMKFYLIYFLYSYAIGEDIRTYNRLHNNIHQVVLYVCRY